MDNAGNDMSNSTEITPGLENWIALAVSGCVCLVAIIAIMLICGWLLKREADLRKDSKSKELLEDEVEEKSRVSPARPRTVDTRDEDLSEDLAGDLDELGNKKEMKVDMKRPPASGDLVKDVNNPGRNAGLGRVCFQVSYSTKHAELKVQIIRAEKLKGEYSTSRDPYVNIHIWPHLENTMRTQVQRRTCNPTWDETFLLNGFRRTHIAGKVLHLEVFDYRRLTRNESLGNVIFPLDYLLSTKADQGKPVWKYLQLGVMQNTGSILVSLCYRPDKQELLVIIHRAVITMLPKKLSVGSLELFTRVIVYDENNKFGPDMVTRVVVRKMEPNWQDSLIFKHISSEILKRLTLDICVRQRSMSRVGKLVGRLRLGINRTEKEGEQWRNVLRNPGETFVEWHYMIVE